MIIDMAISHNTMVKRKVIEHLVVCRTHAHKFVFDKEASRLLGRFSRECTDLVILHRQFAKAPYDLTYMEFDAYEFFDQKPDLPGPVRQAFLYDRGDVYTLLQWGQETMVSPLLWYTGERGSKVVPPHQFPAVDWKAMWPKDGYVRKMQVMLGASGITIAGVPNIKDITKEEVINTIENEMSDLIFSNEMFWMSDKPHIKFLQDGVLFNEIRGDLRHIWAMLLWLNSVPKSIRYSPVPVGHRLTKGKRITLSAHNTVHIHLKGKEEIRHAYIRATRKRDAPRRHDVKGHWCHHGGLVQGCSHTWPSEPNRKKIYVCQRCGRERWWRKPCKRGDESKGWIDKDYQAEI